MLVILRANTIVCDMGYAVVPQQIVMASACLFPNLRRVHQGSIDALGPIAVCSLDSVVAAASTTSTCRPQVYALMRFGFSRIDDCSCI